MNLYLNGQSSNAPDGATVERLLEELGLPTKGVAVERNLEIVPKSAYATTSLMDGDRVEIVQFVGGG